jgi:uncharacterized membrane protein YeaQ/YmgE (transglycosylase-associated protein family)
MATFADVVLDPGGIIAWILVGLAAGWLAGRVMKGSGYGLVGDLVVGLIGSLVGALLFGALTPSLGVYGLIGSILVAFVGAVIFIAIVRAVAPGKL